eukprot:scaffold276579_cov18-Prasinocladus_malaysianus.AAC.1
MTPRWFCVPQKLSTDQHRTRDWPGAPSNNNVLGGDILGGPTTRSVLPPVGQSSFVRNARYKPGVNPAAA